MASLLGNLKGVTSLFRYLQPASLHKPENALISLGSIRHKSRGRNSNKLGLKKTPGQFVKQRHIIVRQRGTKFHPGENVFMGKDHTLHARVDGILTISRRILWSRLMSKKGYRQSKVRRYLSVYPVEPFQPRFVLSNVFLPGERFEEVDMLAKEMSADRMKLVDSLYKR